MRILDAYWNVMGHALKVSARQGTPVTKTRIKRRLIPTA
jgi:hypothetical protein